MDDLKGKRILITGSSLGIGAAVARGFGRAGAAVAVHYRRSAAEAKNVVADIKAAGGFAVAVQADLIEPGAPARLIDGAAAALGGLDILVNNAGSIVKRVAVAEADDAYFERILRLNVTSVLEACRHAVPLLRAAGGGSIINTSSTATWTGGGGGTVIYAGTKGFVTTFTRGLAKETAEFGIRVNAVAPGLIDTPLHDGLTPPETLDRLAKRAPLGRIGQPEDCVGAYLYLASAKASGYVTGAVIEVSGGVVMH